MTARTILFPTLIRRFADIVGSRLWNARIAEIGRAGALGQRAGRVLLQRHALELTLERLRVGGRSPGATEARLVALAAEAASVFDSLTPPGRERMRAAVREAFSGENTLVPLLHLVRTAARQRAAGFEVSFAGFDEAAPFDLLLQRDGLSAEVACAVVSGEEGREVHRGAWVRFVDRIDPDLQTWLAAHPGRYLLKLTLPQGLRAGAEGLAGLAALHQRVRAMLEGCRRADHDEAAVLRLDPLMLAVAQASELGLLQSLRDEFGPEAHLAVTAVGSGVFVLAARAGRENEMAAAIRRRMAALAPARFTGSRPGILAMFVEDIDRVEWRLLRERLELEGEARQFLTHPAARAVAAVSFASRLELLGAATPDAATDGELRFRNPAHPAARAAGLAPVVCSV
jgi:hypothetical protein